MLGGKEVCRAIEVTDNVKMSDLSIADQIRLILASLSNSGDAEISNADRLSVDRLKKIAALRNFIDKAIQRMNELGKSKVTAKLSHEFLPYIGDVEKAYGRFYNLSFSGVKQSEMLSLPFIITIEKRESKHE